ncbi:unnamed protein product, partial [Rotaria magnacalcarata]
FRNIDFTKRRRFVQLVDSVKESGGTVRLFSSMHASGERLSQLTGIAAILRFPMPDLDLFDEHHHHHAEVTNEEQDELENDNLSHNPNRPVHHFDNTDDDQSMDNNRTFKENSRAEASAW